MVEGGDGKLGIVGSLEVTIAFEEDDDDFRVMLILEDCAFCDGSLLKGSDGGLGVLVPWRGHYHSGKTRMIS